MAYPISTWFNNSMDLPPTDYQSTISQQVQARMQDLGWNASRVAQVSGLDPATISRIQHGRTTCQTSTLVQLADGLECSVDYLLGREETAQSLEATPQSAEGLALRDCVSHLFDQSKSIFGDRMDQDVEKKRAVARYVVKHFISQFADRPALQRIILDSGSVPTFVAIEFIRAISAREVTHNLDILTTNLMAALYFQDFRESNRLGWRQISCSIVGGALQFNSVAIVGDKAAEAILGVEGRWHLSIISPSGINYETGLYAIESDQYSSKKAMLKRSQTSVIVADDSKIRLDTNDFPRTGLGLFASSSEHFLWENVHIVTNDGPYSDYDEFKKNLPDNFHLA